MWRRGGGGGLPRRQQRPVQVTCVFADRASCCDYNAREKGEGKEAVREDMRDAIMS